jgi:glycerol-3-phosphate acyltransferase PlsX
MGGDEAPRTELEGCRLALEEDQGLEVYLVGPAQKMEEDLPPRTRLIEAPEQVVMDDSPAQALRQKPNSSIARAIRLLKEHKVDGVVSAGNTGAVMAFALTILGLIPGAERPALAGFFPTHGPNGEGSVVVLDIGANVSPRPEQLVNFGRMGSTVAEFLLGRTEPRVGLLNIGQEPSKGNELTRAAYPLLERSGVNFVGNVEACEILKGGVDVVICDGFSGNIMLKFGEGVTEILGEMLQEYLASESKYRLRRWFSKPVLYEFLSRMNYEEAGGGLLLGINGTIVVAHGRSTPKAIKNAIHTAQVCAGTDLVYRLQKSLGRSG